MILYPRLSRLFPPALLVHPAHLKKNPITGHLLKSSSGHLVKGCGCGFTLASSYTLTLADVSWGCCMAQFNGFFWGGAEMIEDPNTTFAVPFSTTSTGQHRFFFEDLSTAWYRRHFNSPAPCEPGSTDTVGIQIELNINTSGTSASLLVQGAASDAGDTFFATITGTCLMEEPTLVFTNSFSGCSYPTSVAGGGVAVATRIA